MEPTSRTGGRRFDAAGAECKDGGGTRSAAVRERNHCAGPSLGHAKAPSAGRRVGNSRQPPEAWPDFHDGVPRRRTAAGPTPLLEKPALALRFAADDIKAYYEESAMSDGRRQPAVRSMTGSGIRPLPADFLRALHLKGMESDNNALKTVCARFFVPVPWIKK